MPQNQSQLVFTMDKRYKLKDDGSKIILDVIVGDKGQSPDIDVKLNTKKILEHHEESVKSQLIGIDSEIQSKILKITGCVVDTADDSNKIEVTVKLKGGVSELTKKFSVTVEEEGEQVDLAFIIRFTI